MKSQCCFILLHACHSIQIALADSLLKISLSNAALLMHRLQQSSHQSAMLKNCWVICIPPPEEGMQWASWK